METKNDTLTAQESLALISSMIQQAKGNIRDNAFYFLFWGWIIVLANIGVFALLKLGYPNPYLIWLIVIPGWVITFIKVFRDSTKTKSTTHLDKITGALWISFGVFAVAMPLLGNFINYQINPVILMVGGITTVTSSVILRYTPLGSGGAVMFLFGIGSFFVSSELQFLVAALAISLGYLVPGYMLKFQK